MKINRIFSLDTDIVEWLKSKSNMSDYVNTILHEARISELPKKPKIIRCEICGSEYADVLKECPECLAKKNNELTERILTAKQKEEERTKEEEKKAEQHAAAMKIAEQDLKEAWKLYKKEPEVIKAWYKTLTGEDWDFTEEHLNENPSALLFAYTHIAYTHMKKRGD